MAYYPGRRYFLLQTPHPPPPNPLIHSHTDSLPPSIPSLFLTSLSFILDHYRRREGGRERTRGTKEGERGTGVSVDKAHPPLSPSFFLGLSIPYEHRQNSPLKSNINICKNSTEWIYTEIVGWIMSLCRVCVCLKWKEPSQSLLDPEIGRAHV